MTEQQEIKIITSSIKFFQKHQRLQRQQLRIEYYQTIQHYQGQEQLELELK